MNLRNNLIQLLDNNKEIENQSDYIRIFDICQEYFKANHHNLTGNEIKIANKLHELGFLEKKGVPYWKDNCFVGTNYYFKKVESPIFSQGAYTGWITTKTKTQTKSKN